MTSASDAGGPWAEVGDEETRLALGGSAVVNEAFQRLKDEIERVLGESVAAAQEADREAAAIRHVAEERERRVLWLEGLCREARSLLSPPENSAAAALVIELGKV